jgi:hypothetical protein
MCRTCRIYIYGVDGCMFGFGGKARRKRPLGRSTRTCEVNIKINLREKEWYGRDFLKS